jgi:hypothetical protein
MPGGVTSVTYATACEFECQHPIDRGGRRLRQRDLRIARRQQNDRRSRCGYLATLILAPDCDVNLVAHVRDSPVDDCASDPRHVALVVELAVLATKFP